MNHKHQLTVAVYEALRNPAGVVFAHNHSGIDGLFKAIWKNTSLTGGMALTSLGTEYFINLLDLQHWDFSVSTTTSADILMMERYMPSPYYLTSGQSKTHKNLILFDETVATQLILYNNDLKLFLRAYDGASDRPITKR